MFLAFGLVMQFPIVLVLLAQGRHRQRRAAASRPALRVRGHLHLRRRGDAGRRSDQPDRSWRGHVPAVRADDLARGRSNRRDRSKRPSDRGRATNSEAATGAPEAEPSRAHVAIISGLSGAGKTAASKLLEDLGYRVVDNLPAELLRNLAQLVARDPARYERAGAGARRARRRRAGGVPAGASAPSRRAASARRSSSSRRATTC